MNEALAEHQLSKLEWQVLTDFEVILEVRVWPLF
jgi:hypothetical protein